VAVPVHLDAGDAVQRLPGADDDRIGSAIRELDKAGRSTQVHFISTLPRTNVYRSAGRRALHSELITARSPRERDARKLSKIDRVARRAGRGARQCNGRDRVAGGGSVEAVIDVQVCIAGDIDVDL